MNSAYGEVFRVLAKSNKFGCVTKPTMERIQQTAQEQDDLPHAYWRQNQDFDCILLMNSLKYSSENQLEQIVFLFDLYSMQELYHIINFTASKIYPF